MDNLKVDIVPYFNDNYCYLLHDASTGNTALFDCGDAQPVKKRLNEKGWNLTMICTTHFHADHAGGVNELQQAFPDARLVKPAGESRLPAAGLEVSDGQQFDFGKHKILALSVPAHTRYCTSYYIDGCLFVGDTLFSGGCGRLFEGQAGDLEKALAKLTSYPDETQVFHGHEYTLSNLEFARTVEPDNQSLTDYIEQVKELRKKGGYTTPTTVGHEKMINPFLRVDQKSIIANIDPGSRYNRTERLGLIRSQKDAF
jgi:hydroxyacylglutathione hydrolase